MSRVPESNPFGPPLPPAAGNAQVPPQPQGHAPTPRGPGYVPPVPPQAPHGRGAHANFGYARAPLTPDVAVPLAKIFANRSVDLNDFSDVPPLLCQVDPRALQTAVTLDALAKRLVPAGMAFAYPLSAPPLMRDGMLRPLLRGTGIKTGDALAALETLQRSGCVVHGSDPATDARQSIRRFLHTAMPGEPERSARLAYCIEYSSNGAELVSLAKTMQRRGGPPAPIPPRPAPLPHPMSAAANVRPPSGPPGPHGLPHVPAPPPVREGPADKQVWPPASPGSAAAWAGIVEPNIDRQVFEDVVVLTHVARTAAAHNPELLGLVQQGSVSPQIVDWLTQATGIARTRIADAFTRFQRAVPPGVMNPQGIRVGAAYNRALIKAYLEAEGVNSVNLRGNGSGPKALSDQFLDFVANTKDLPVLLRLSQHVHRSAKQE